MGSRRFTRAYAIGSDDAGCAVLFAVDAGTRRLIEALWASFRQCRLVQMREILRIVSVWSNYRYSSAAHSLQHIDFDFLNLQPGHWWRPAYAFGLTSLNALDRSFEWETALAWWRAAEFLAKALAADRENFRYSALV